VQSFISTDVVWEFRGAVMKFAGISLGMGLAIA
jgi:hypothetical protein